ncbi:formate dehydrogenase accessory sulfurtransferase FdhD [Pleomorphovibrio marinus]|uniref:formate dehydrogenase accessory sulfurtransferase FdhD n=1 Tax=Pleomorphovibrio marinus TaxID=2164132 RepID=UPI000E0C498D|nr:formate dehydrogenase accessory sulfurtransferase FdhD [Pleomorphovibrio marinus]
MKHAGLVTKGEVQKKVGNTTLVEQDLLAVEEPLQIKLEWGQESSWRSEDLSITMRTPGHDFDLVRGMLWSEGLLESPKDLQWIRYCQKVEREAHKNVVIAKWMPGLKPARDLDVRRNTQNSSCGLCGKSTLPAFLSANKILEVKKHNNLKINILKSCYSSILEMQTGFKFTGGFHGVALFDLEGKLLVLREDVGRHNAMDKVIGATLKEEAPPFTNSFVWLSGRVSYEMVQKAVMAGIPTIAAVGAPTSLAVELAMEKGVTLIGFLREDRMNIYAHPNRVCLQ